LNAVAVEEMGRVTRKLENCLSRLNDVVGTNLAFQSFTVGRSSGVSRGGNNQRVQEMGDLICAECKGFSARSVKTLNRNPPESIKLDQGCLKWISCEGVLARKLFFIQPDKCLNNMRRNRPKDQLVLVVAQAVAERIVL
jgi:hypothetical protein